MFSAKDIKKEGQANADVIETIIGLNSEVEGNIVSQGSLRIDGKLRGDITVKGNLVVGDQGSLEGSVNAKNIVVAGRITGNVVALEKIEINKSGRLIGDIISKFVVIEEGSHFTGNCKMERKDDVIPLLSGKNKM